MAHRACCRMSRLPPAIGAGGRGGAGLHMACTPRRRSVAITLEPSCRRPTSHGRPFRREISDTYEKSTAVPEISWTCTSASRRPASQPSGHLGGAKLAAWPSAAVSFRRSAHRPPSPLFRHLPAPEAFSRCQELHRMSEGKKYGVESRPVLSRSSRCEARPCHWPEHSPHATQHTRDLTPCVSLSPISTGPIADGVKIRHGTLECAEGACRLVGLS